MKGKRLPTSNSNLLLLFMTFFDSRIVYLLQYFLQVSNMLNQQSVIIKVSPCSGSLALRQMDPIDKKGLKGFFFSVITSVLYQSCGDVCKISQWSLVCYIKELATGVSKVIEDFSSIIGQSMSLTYS